MDRIDLCPSILGVVCQWRLVNVILISCPGAERSADKMITSAPLSDPSLRSFVLPTKPFQMQNSDARHNPFVIKINLEYDDKQECFLYPTGQCDWYFVCRANHQARIPANSLLGSIEQGATHCRDTWPPKRQGGRSEIQALQHKPE